MPNHVLLVFDPVHHPIKGLDQASLDPGESMLEIAHQVARKVFWDSESGDAPATCKWQSVCPAEPNETLSSFLERIDQYIARGESVLPSDSNINLPCFAIIDVSLFLYPRTSTVGSASDEIERINDWLLKLKKANRPVFLVATVPAPASTRKVLDSLAPNFIENIHLARADSNIWDALYNLIKRGEHEFHCRQVDNASSEEKVVSWDLLKQPANDDSNAYCQGSGFQEDIKENISPSFKTVKPSVFIRNRVFHGTVELAGLTFAGSVIFENCVFHRDVAIRHCKFNGNLHFHSCRFHNDLLLEISQFKYRTPWFHKCIFKWRFVFRRNLTPNAYQTGSAPTMMFSRSSFDASNRITMPKERLRIAFYSCNFQEGEYTEINWQRDRNNWMPPIKDRSDFPGRFRDESHRYGECNERLDLPSPIRGSTVDNVNGVETNFDRDELAVDDAALSTEAAEKLATHSFLRQFYDRRHNGKKEITKDLDIYVRLINCDIAGRFVLRENPFYTQFYRDPTRLGLMLSLEGSTVRGTINLSEIRIRWLDVESATFTSGGIVMNDMRAVPEGLSFLPRKEIDRGSSGGMVRRVLYSNIVWRHLLSGWGIFALIATAIGLGLSFEYYQNTQGLLPSGALWMLGLPTAVMAGFAVWRAIAWGVVIQPTHEVNHAEDALSKREFTVAASRTIRRFLNVLAVQAEFTGLVYEELILDGREQWRFADSIGSRRYWESPQTTLGIQRPHHAEMAASSDPKSVTAYKKSLFTSVAQQYEDLRRAFANTPITDHLEDFCHFKALKYRTLASDIEISLAQTLAVRLFLGAMYFLVMATAWTAFHAEWNSAGRWIPAVVGWFIAILFIWYCWTDDSLKTALTNTLSNVILKGVLAYGVYPSRVFVSTIAIVVIYTWVYLISAMFAPEDNFIGHIQKTDHVFLGNTVDSLVEKNGMITVGEWSEAPRAIGELLYYSAVTFTTLGYGDFQPQGFMRFVSASEAFIGAIMIAAITVSVVRQFLRR